MESYILIAILGVMAVIVFIFRVKLNAYFKKPETVKKIKELCVWADDNIRGSKLGQERLAYVCGRLCQLVPKPLQPFVTADKLTKVINMIFDEIKTELRDGTTVAAR